MSGCPFGFSAQHSSDVSDGADKDTKSPRKDASGGKCPFSGGGATNDDRFDYNKDPISWFYQNQIKSEEQFQAKKSELRSAAHERLECLFEKKGKHLIIDSDDDFSIATSELSAWDSDVHSIRTLASCANSWAEATDFKAPALLTLRLVVLVTMAASLWSGYKAVLALSQVNRYWGIITVGWVPFASLGAASVAAVCALSLWWLTESKHKAGLLAGQIGMQLLCAGCTLIAVLCWLYPSHVDPKFQSMLCNAPGPQPSDTSSRLCHYLPVVQEQIGLAVATIMWCNVYLAVLSLAASCAGSWHFWELAYVEKKAAKHKRRRKHRKNSIPWDKIKVEDIGPVSYCGGSAPSAQARKAAAASAAGMAAATTTSSKAAKKDV